MTVSIRPIDPVSRPHFAGEVSGVDITRPLSHADAAAISAGMDQYGVLVFHDQHFTDETQLAFSRNFGALEQATGDIAQGSERRLSMDVNDISNLDKNNQLLARDDRRRLFGLGNRLWHSDSSFKAVSAKYSLLSARRIPSAGGNTEFADMRAAYDALDDDTKAECENLICEHSQLFSRSMLGFTDFHRRRAPQVRAGAAAAGAAASGDRAQVAVPGVARRRHPRLAGAGGARVPARPDRACDAAAVRLRACLAAMGPGDVGQPRHDASRASVQQRRGARHASHHGGVRTVHDGTGGMIKVVGLLTRKPELTHEQFVKHWLEIHGPLAMPCRAFGATCSRTSSVRARGRISRKPMWTSMGLPSCGTTMRRHWRALRASPEMKRLTDDGALFIGRIKTYIIDEKQIIPKS